MNEIAQFAPGLDRIEAGSLYPHQADGVAYLLSKKRVILADDMGLGKTARPLLRWRVHLTARSWWYAPHP